jgi:tetratricopeptide (TPR) repeat protein
LARFAFRGSSPEETRFIVAHLVHGCSSCSAALRSSFELALSPAGEEQVGLGPTQEAGYDLAIERALAAVRLHGSQALSRKRKADQVRAKIAAQGGESVSVKREGAYPVYEALLTRSWESRHDDPQKMIEYAWQAVQAAKSLAQEGFTTRQLADLQARAFGELGNAFRVADRLSDSESMLEQALSRSRAGTGDPFLALRLADLRASLLISTHRYTEAVEVLEYVQVDNLELGDRHSAGRALISQGICLGYLGQVRDALGRIDHGLSMIDEKREPRLRVQAIHNQLLLMVSVGLLDQALAFLARNRTILQKLSGRLDRAKLRDIEGQIQAGLGNLDLAEEAFREATEEFDAAGVKGLHAVACLDLATVLKARGRDTESQELAHKALQVFCRLNLKDSAAEAEALLGPVFQTS